MCSFTKNEVTDWNKYTFQFFLCYLEFVVNFGILINNKIEKGIFKKQSHKRKQSGLEKNCDYVVDKNNEKMKTRWWVLGWWGAWFSSLLFYYCLPLPVRTCYFSCEKGKKDLRGVNKYSHAQKSACRIHIKDAFRLFSAINNVSVGYQPTDWVSFFLLLFLLEQILYKWKGREEMGYLLFS